MILVSEVNAKVPGTFGDMAEHVFGYRMRYLVQVSIVLSQLGTCITYIVFIIENATALMKHLAPKMLISPWAFAAIQIMIYIPMALVRHLKTFAAFSLIGDLFILFGLMSMCTVGVMKIIHEGVSSDVVLFNQDRFGMFLGTAVFTFEGSGMVTPVVHSMARPHMFGRVLIMTMSVTLVLYLLVGSVGYLAWGKDVETIVLLNLPPSNLSSAVYVLYISAIVLTLPLTLFPAIRIMESSIFVENTALRKSRSGKWKKNVFRAAIVLCLGLFAVLGTKQLGKMVSLIGAFTCIPLSFIYPSLFYAKVFDNQHWLQRTWSALVVIFGVLTMLYCVYQTLKA
jgi:proton-coupled amino acid transporter